MQVQVNAILKNGHQHVVALVEADDLFSWGPRFKEVMRHKPLPEEVEKVIAAELSERNEKILIKYRSAWFDANQFGVGL